APADGFANQRFGRVGKAVQGIGNHQQEGDQHGIGGQDDIPLPGTLGGEEGRAQQQGDGTHHDVAVHLQDAQVIRYLAEQLPGQLLALRHAFEHDHHTDGGGTVFGHHGGHGHTPAVPAQNGHEEYDQHDVDAV